MIKILKYKLKKNTEILALIILFLFAETSTSFFNFKKTMENKAFNNFIDNIYLKKTLNHIVDNLEPKYKKIKHKIRSGETFDKILENYSVNKQEILKIKNSLNKKVNLNKLNTKQIIQFSLDKTNNKINEFSYQISNTEKIYLKRNIEKDIFNEEIQTIKLNKSIVYKENLIIQSLYTAAIEQKIPANIIIEFAGIYGFQVDFQRDVRRKDKFQVMYEIFLNDKNEIVENGKFFCKFKTKWSR